MWLRRAGMSLTTRTRAASLTGDAWRRFLDELAGESVFDQADSESLVAVPYRTGASVDLAAPDAERILDACERWLQAAVRMQKGARA